MYGCKLLPNDYTKLVNPFIFRSLNQIVTKKKNKKYKNTHCIIVTKNKIKYEIQKYTYTVLLAP